MKVSRIETVIQFVTDQEASSRGQPLPARVQPTTAQSAVSNFRSRG